MSNDPATFDITTTNNALQPLATVTPHPTLRPVQQLALADIAALELPTADHPNGIRFAFAQLPTGTGKSYLAHLLGSGNARVTVLVGTHAQGDQLATSYGFYFLKGKQAYECVEPSHVLQFKRRTGTIPTATDCPVRVMSQCGYASACPYLVAKAEAKTSHRLAVTYQYAIRSAWVQQRGGIAVLDECHSAGEAALDFSELTVSPWQASRYDLPDFPFADFAGYGDNGRGARLTDNARETTLAWLTTSLAKVRRIAGNSDSATPSEVKARSFANALQYMVAQVHQGEWFLQSGEPGSGGLYLKSLTASAIAPRLWQAKQQVVLMSATIGNPASLANELGIATYAFLDYPHPVPVSARPVFALPGAPRMNAKNLADHPELFEQQARVIAAFVRSLDPAWRGVVLTTSRVKIQQLRRFLTPMLPNRVVLQNDLTTSSVAERVAQFVKDARPGLIAVDTIQGWGHGLDLRGDLARFSVVAGVPHDNPSDPYHKAFVHLGQGKKRYRDWLAYLAVVQAAARGQRGETDEAGEYLQSVAAIADEGALTNTAKRFYPRFFTEAWQ